MEFDKILLVDDAARRRQRGDDEQPVADVGIGDLIDVFRVLELNGDARSIGPDQIAGEVERVGRIDDGVADIDRPHAAVGGDARQPRAVELEPHHVGGAGMGEFDSADGVARLAVERAQIDLGLGVEDQPQRVGALKHRRADRSFEREGQLEIGALLAEIGGNIAGAVAVSRRGWRRRRGRAALDRRRRSGLRRAGCGGAACGGAACGEADAAAAGFARVWLCNFRRSRLGDLRRRRLCRLRCCRDDLRRRGSRSGRRTSLSGVR